MINKTSNIVETKLAKIAQISRERSIYINISFTK